jgi:hypothetical protein
MNTYFFGKEENFDIDIYKMYRTKVDWVIQLHKMKSLFKNMHYFNQILASTNKFSISCQIHGQGLKIHFVYVRCTSSSITNGQYIIEAS